MCCNYWSACGRTYKTGLLTPLCRRTCVQAVAVVEAPLACNPCPACCAVQEAVRTQARALTMVEKLQVQLTQKEQERQVGGVGEGRFVYALV